MLALTLYIPYYLLLFSDRFLESLLGLSIRLSIVVSPSSSSVDYCFGYLGDLLLLSPIYGDLILRYRVVYYSCKLGNEVQHCRL